MFNCKKIFLSIFSCFIVLLGTNLNAQSGWNIQATAVTFYKVYFINSATGWAVGSQGMILKTTNSGINWIGKKCPTKEELRSVFFIDLNIGWISGRYGTIFKSTNGGESWNKQNTNTDQDLYSVYFINSLTGWACGGRVSDHILIKSTNGGISWYPQSVDSNHIFLSEVQFLNQDTGFLCGYQHGLIFKTTNGGNNWFISFSNYYSPSIRSIYFNTELTGWAVGNNSMNGQSIVLTTTNIGETWSQMNIPNSTTLRMSITAFQSGIVFTCGLNGYIDRLLGNWSSMQIDTNIILYSIKLVNNSSGWVVGEYGKIALTTNSGNNWTSQIQGLRIHEGLLYDVFFVDTATGWVTGNLGGIFKTTNGGSNWIIQNVPSSSKYGMYFNDINTGFISGISGFLIKTTNGGNSWNYLSSGTVYDLDAINFYDYQTGWTVGSWNTILKTVNGGLNWVSQSTSIENYLKYVKCFSPNLCYISGGNVNENNFIRGIFLKTTNGGVNWSTLYIRDSIYLYGGDFINENTGWLVGQRGSIYKTVNGGLNWQNLNYDNKSRFYSADFVDENIGYVVGDSGIVIKTTNGGLNWTEQNSGVNMSLFCVQFKGQNKGWISGNGGIILKTTNGGNMIGISQNLQIPYMYLLAQNFPNPFNPVTKIKYDIPKRSNVILKVYDILGREILTLVNEFKNPGSYETEFDGSNLASGLYFYRLEAGEYSFTKKMVLIK